MKVSNHNAPIRFELRCSPLSKLFPKHTELAPTLHQLMQVDKAHLSGGSLQARISICRSNHDQPLRTCSAELPESLIGCSATDCDGFEVTGFAGINQ
jgi:hypothetical protein